MTYLREATLFILTTAVDCCEPYETISIDDNTLVIRYASLTITTAFRRNPVVSWKISHYLAWRLENAIVTLS